jgi:hypothetical protein
MDHHDNDNTYRKAVVAVARHKTPRAAQENFMVRCVCVNKIEKETERGVKVKL